MHLDFSTEEGISSLSKKCQGNKILLVEPYSASVQLPDMCAAMDRNPYPSNAEEVTARLCEGLTPLEAGPKRLRSMTCC